MTAFFFCFRVFSNLFATHPDHLAPFRTMRLFLSLLLLFVLVGCTPQLSLAPPMTGSGVPSTAPQTSAITSGLRVRTHDDGTLLFHGDDWRLTPTGIRGKADVSTSDGTQYTTDTTLSYWDTAEAGPAGRQSTMGQFMLTILGVILVLGLAAIILYAAFLATDR
jgi:hypothetical protein